VGGLVTLYARPQRSVREHGIVKVVAVLGGIYELFVIQTDVNEEE
jgi:hypothetical protein